MSVKLYITKDMFEAWWGELSAFQRFEVTQNIAELFAKRHLKGVAIKEIEDLRKEIKEQVRNLVQEEEKNIVAEYATYDSYYQRIKSLRDVVQDRIKSEVSRQISDLIKEKVELQVATAISEIDVNKGVVSTLKREIEKKVREEIKDKLNL